MPISGVNVSTRRAELDAVRTEIENELGGEIANQVENYLVVVLETGSETAMKEKFDAILQMPGVVSATLAYYSVEDVAGRRIPGGAKPEVSSLLARHAKPETRT
ncbi:MAG: chaperone NapD [bacterium]